MFIKIFTDGSKKDNGDATFAFRIISEEAKIKIEKSGKFKEKQKDITEVETKAILNALDYLTNIHFKNNKPKKIKRILIYSDSKGAIKKIEKEGLINIFIKKINIQKIDLKHVTGHKPQLKKQRFVSNTWCDKSCKEAYLIP